MNAALTLTPTPPSASSDPASGEAVPSTCAGEALVLDDAVLRSWSFGDGVVVLSLLVRSDARGFRTVRLTYAGAQVVGRDATVLTGVPLKPGRTYVLTGEERLHEGDRHEHRLRFFPAPEFAITFDAIDVEA